MLTLRPFRAPHHTISAMGMAGGGAPAPRPGEIWHSEEHARTLEELARTEGILLDPVYTGKAFAGMMQLLRRGAFDGQDDLLFVHTGGTAALFAIDLPR